MVLDPSPPPLEITWDATYIIWAEYSECDIPCDDIPCDICMYKYDWYVDRYTEITWDATYIIWAEYSECDIPCDTCMRHMLSRYHLQMHNHMYDIYLHTYP